MVQPPISFFDAHTHLTHPLILTRSQSRELLQAHLQQQQAVTSFQTHRNMDQQQQAGATEVRTLGRPIRRKQGKHIQNSLHKYESQQNNMQARV